MEDFNSQYANHSKLEQLKQFILEHGTYIELKKGEQFTIQGKVNHRGAYIEHGLLRYTRVDEKGNIHIVGYTFSGEFTGSLCTLIEPNQPSLVTIEAVCDTKICYIPYLKVEEFFATNVETMQVKCTLIEQSYLLILKSATKLFSVLLASKRPLITELADKLRLKYPLLPTISPCPTMRLEAIRSIIPISCRRYPKSV